MRHKEKIKNSIPGRRKKFKIGKAKVCVGNEQQTNVNGTQKSRNPAQKHVRKVEADKMRLIIGEP